MKPSASLIERADLAEELAAGVALRMATTKGELVAAWNLECEHFRGDARQRLQDIYADELLKFAPLSRAG